MKHASFLYAHLPINPYHLSPSTGLSVLYPSQRLIMAHYIIICKSKISNRHLIVKSSIENLTFPLFVRLLVHSLLITSRIMYFCLRRKITQITYTATLGDNSLYVCAFENITKRWNSRDNATTCRISTQKTVCLMEKKSGFNLGCWSYDTFTLII